MKFPEELTEEDEIPHERAVLVGDALVEMDISIGDVYFKKGHAHTVIDIDGSEGTFTVQHSDGERKERDICRQYRNWKSGQLMPVIDR